MTKRSSYRGCTHKAYENDGASRGTRHGAIATHGDVDRRGTRVSTGLAHPQAVRYCRNRLAEARGSPAYGARGSKLVHGRGQTPELQHRRELLDVELLLVWCIGVHHEGDARDGTRKASSR